MARPRSGGLAPITNQTPSFDRKTKSVPGVVEYMTLSPSGAIFMMRNTVATVIDQKTGKLRAIRYCEMEPSIYVDEQSENSVKSTIIFNFGRLFVDHTKPNLREFLDTHPKNEANGGSLFKRIDYENNAKESLSQEFELVDAVSMVRDKSIDELLPVAIAFNINTDAPVSEIKYDLLQIAKSNPKTFIQSFDNPAITMKAKIKKASMYQVIKLDKDYVRWFDSNKMIISVPAGQDPMDVMVRYCLTEAGAAVSAEIERQTEGK
jgi:hypothetical protein